MKIKYNEIDKTLPLIKAILKERGVRDPDHYLNLSADDVINPNVITNMREVSECLNEHIKQGDDAVIVVDEDCDGMTSSAMLYNYLYHYHPDWCIDHLGYVQHETKAHGIPLDKIRNNVKLLLVPDSSSNELDKHKTLHERGIDICIWDHHKADAGYSPDAIVINNQLDPLYNNKTLSGVGMVYKWCQYYDEHYGEVGTADYWLDLLALGCLADVMSMTEYETRYLLNKGLTAINNPFLKVMCEKQSYSMGEKVTAEGLAWYVAPPINAITRIGTLEEKQLVFESMLDSKGKRLIPSTKRGHKLGDMETRAEQACRMCMNVKRHQDDIRNKMAEKLEERIANKDLEKDKVIVIKNVGLEDGAQGLQGLSANKLMAKYQHPIMVLSPVEMEDGLHWAGSARSLNGVDLRMLCENSSLCDYAAGHNAAFGTSIPDAQFFPLIDYLNNALKDETFEATYDVDAEYGRDTLTPATILDIANYKWLWANDVREPLFLLKDFSISKDKIALMGKNKNTIKFDLGKGINAIKFFTSEEEYNKLVQNEAVTLDIVGTFNRNEWDGNVTPQIIIENYEVKQERKWYF